MVMTPIVLLTCAVLVQSGSLPQKFDSQLRAPSNHSSFLQASEPQSFAEGDASVGARLLAALQLWNMPRGWFSDSYLSIYSITSLNAAANKDDNSGSASADFFTASLANYVVPFTSFAYFKARAEVKVKDNGEDENGDGHDLDFNGEVTATAIIQVFDKLIQFKDKDGDGQYTDGTDEVVDTYDFWEMKRGIFAKPSPRSKPKWAKGTADLAARWAKIETADGVFSLKTKGNEGTGTTPDGQKMTPLNVKMDIEINYPNLQAGNLVALGSFVAFTTAKAGGEATVGNAVYIPQSEGHMTLDLAWDGTATMEGGKDGITVKAGGLASAKLDDIPDKNAKAAVSGHGDAEVTIKRQYFAFAPSSAGKIVWDPILGMVSKEDDPTQRNSFPSWARWLIGFACIALVGSLIAFLMLKKKPTGGVAPAREVQMS